MAHKTNEDMLLEDELANAFLTDDDTTLADQEFNITDQDDALQQPQPQTTPISTPTAEAEEEEWEDNANDFPGQLAVDVYETADKLVVKARTAGISKSDLNVTISDNTLTISGVLSGGEDANTTFWHIQECYWGEFSRTIALPVQVKENEDSVKAELKDGVLTITFEKEKVETPLKIAIQ